MSKKKLIKDKCIISILEILNIKDDTLFLSNFKGSDKVIHIDSFYNLTFRTAIDLIYNKQVYTTKVVITETDIKPKVNKPKVDSNKIISKSKITLNDIYK